MIHVCFGLSDKDGRYSKFTGTAILSMFENTYEEVTVHILHDNTLSNDNRDKLSYIAGRYNQRIEFHNVEEVCKEEMTILKKLFENYQNIELYTFGSFYRLLTHKLFSNEIKKILYLDSDIIINLDIAELWQFKLYDKPIAAVPEMENRKDTTNVKQSFPLCSDGITDAEDYFNAGILIINLNKIRQDEVKNLWKGIHFLSENPKYACFDQEVLNYCFSKRCLKLPHKFNYFPVTSRQRGEFNTDNKICHFAGSALNLDASDNFNRLWLSYFEKTPWFKSDVIGHIDESFRKIINENVAQLKNLALQISALMSGKTRAFFTTTQNVEFVKNVFAVRDDEEIIPFAGSDSIQFLIDFMKENFGKKLFFILFRDYWQLRIVLLQSGFVEGRDFINAAMFLTEANGINLNTYPVVRNM